MLGLATLVVVALGDADQRLLGGLRAQRAAEAAAEAGGAVVADRLLELHGEEVDERRRADVIGLALADSAIAPRAESAAREVLAPLRGELLRLSLERKVDELSVRAEVRVGGETRTARVGVRLP